jgi:uncharacterized membrane protein (UPF0127 family)
MPRQMKRYLVIVTILIGTIGIVIPLSRYKPYISRDELSFYKDHKLIKKITIMSVETNQYRTQQDLMYYDGMPDSCGMLFIFKDNGTAPFQMKKHHQPFDIIAVDPNGNIVIIERNVSSSSEKALPANNPVLYNYIVAVNSGFCNANRISEDVSVTFELKKK